jgi:cation-transporting ATPase 13A3/4/5
MRYNVSCPALCVPDIDLCPTGTKPQACPQGQIYCQDGTCKNGTSHQAAWSNAQPCACATGYRSGSTLSDKYSVLFPCRTVRVNVPNYAQNDIVGDAPLLERCRAATRLASTNQTLRSPFFVQCAAKPVARLTFTEPEFLGFYLSLSSQIVILLCYDLYRRLKKVCIFTANYSETCPAHTSYV